MMRCTAVGTPEQAQEQLARLATETGADELMLAPASPHRPDRLRAVELVLDPAAVSVG